MMYSNDRKAYRQFFYSAWKKYLSRLPVEALESQLIEIMVAHPEYHYLLNQSEVSQEFSPEENPFLHMSLHLSLREQLATDRPHGINQIYKNLIAKYTDVHHVEHLMMGCLAHVIHSSQKTGTVPSDDIYLAELQYI